RKRIGRHARARELGPTARHEAAPIEPSALPGGGAPGFVASRRDERADQRFARAYQRHRDRPAGPAADEIARAVDRVDQPAQPSLEPLGMVDGLFGQPTGGGKQRAQLTAQERIHGEIRGAYRAAAELFPAFERMAAAGPLPQRNVAGLAADIVQALAVDHCAANWASRTGFASGPALCLCAEILPTDRHRR